MTIRVWAVGYDTADAAPLHTFHQVPKDNTIINRKQPDLINTDPDADIAQLRDLDAPHLNDVRPDSAHRITSPDPEGNEFDLVAG